ncbi:hypothetical protein NDU88_002431 [Pleurodeles waltl]|uniref:Uncharacterized protein n=1 Tax=Pleurodeles waltl TaxID=8319 RepID=A0AAV7KYY3_PLEWA|nr:hypothetical protein NDU88_002431 [Pleurodeles waltl]
MKSTLVHMVETIKGTLAPERRRQFGAPIWGSTWGNHGFPGHPGAPPATECGQVRESNHRRSGTTGEEVGALCGGGLGPGCGVRLIPAGRAGPVNGSWRRGQYSHRRRSLRPTTVEPPAPGAGRRAQPAEYLKPGLRCPRTKVKATETETRGQSQWRLLR